MFETIKKKYRSYKFHIKICVIPQIRRKANRAYHRYVKGIYCKIYSHNFSDSSDWNGHQETCYRCGLHHMITRSTSVYPDGRVDKHLKQNNRYYYL